jgi:hypothetical protein
VSRLFVLLLLILAGSILKLLILARFVLELLVLGLSLRCFCLLGTDKALSSKADKILAVKLYERLSYQRSVLRAVILEQSTLQLLFVIVGRNEMGFISRGFMPV